MSKFVREEYVVDGVKTVVHTAGKGEPLVLFHGAGTAEGFDFAEAWSDRFRVIVPYHPGWGESGDDPTFTDIHDYVMHYLYLFEALKLDQFSLVGLSFGGYLAANFAIEHAHRLKKLVLLAPYGIDDPEHPALDIISIPADRLVPMLVSNFDTLKRHLPAAPDIDFIAARYREATTFARLFWDRPIDPKFTRHLGRVKTPTLILWGDEDKIMPVEQTKLWSEHIPAAEIRIFKGAGHLVHLEKPEALDVAAKFLS